MSNIDDNGAYMDDVDAALADLALSAVSTLSMEMRTARASKDKIAAANSILDRLGYGRTTRAQAEVADREIRNALAAAKRTAARVTDRELEEAKPQALDNLENAKRLTIEVPDGD